jgi:hypothetical protein
MAYRQQKVDEAIPYLEQAAAAWARRRDQPGLAQPERDRARTSLQETLETTAQMLVGDGQRLAQDGQTELARQRYEKARATAPPGSQAAQQAQDALSSLGQSPAMPVVPQF